MLRINGKHFTVLGMYFWTTQPIILKWLPRSKPVGAFVQRQILCHIFTNNLMEVYDQQMKNDVTSPGFCPGNIIFAQGTNHLRHWPILCNF